MRLWVLLRNIWPFRFLFEKRSSLIILDQTTFEESKSKVISVWSWKRFKTEKVLAHYKQGKFIIRRIS